jgi:hypothetical protein
MRRLLIIGATVVALSATATVALAGIGPVHDVDSRVASLVQGQDIDPIMARIIERLQSARHWHAHDATDRVSDHPHDTDRDRVHDRRTDVAPDTDQMMDQVHDQTMDVIHDQNMGSTDNMGSMGSTDNMGSMGSTDNMGSMGSTDNIGNMGSMGDWGRSDH